MPNIHALPVRGNGKIAKVPLLAPDRPDCLAMCVAGLTGAARTIVGAFTAAFENRAFSETSMRETWRIIRPSNETSVAPPTLVIHDAVPWAHAHTMPQSSHVFRSSPNIIAPKFTSRDARSTCCACLIESPLARQRHQPIHHVPDLRPEMRSARPHCVHIDLLIRVSIKHSEQLARLDIAASHGAGHLTQPDAGQGSVNDGRAVAQLLGRWHG